MPLKPVGEKCKLEVYGPDEEGTRIICNSTDDCPLEHPGEITLECFGAEQASEEARLIKAQQVKGVGYSDATSIFRKPGQSAGGISLCPPSASDTLELQGAGISEGKSVGVESGLLPGRSSGPDSHINALPGSHLNKIISHELDRGKLPDHASESEKTFSKNLSPPDSHMVVGKDARRDALIRKYVDKLNEISMEMYLEQARSATPILGPVESRMCMKCGVGISRPNIVCGPCLDKLTKEMLAAEYGPGSSGKPRLKRRKRHTVRQSGGMIRMPGNKPEPPEPEEESLFETDDEVHGPVTRKLKAQPELQRPQPTIERTEQPEEEDDQQEGHGDLAPILSPEEEEALEDEGIEILLDDFTTTGLPDIGGYAVDLEVHTDEEGDHSAVLTVDNVTIEIMLGDFIEIVEALMRKLPRMREIQSS